MTDISLHSRVVPVVEEASDDWSGDGTDATVAGGEGSERIQAFVQLAQAHGAQVLFVRLPVSPVSRADKIDPALQRGALAVLGELGVGYLDLRDDSLGEEAFEGPVHLSAEGRTRLTQELGQQLGALGLHRGKAPPPVSVPSGPQRRP